MSRFPEELLDEIKARVDLVGLVSEHVRLTKRGTSFVGLCPFHDERTPSFTVVPSKGFFHCFGCGASGSAFNFLMRLEGRTFVEAVRELARRGGVELPTYRRETPEEELERRRKSDRKEWLYKVNEMACGFFEENLAGPAGAGARKYLEDRGISMGAAREHRLGLALDDWDSLPRFLSRNTVPEEVVRTSGLVRARTSGDGYYNLFRGRLLTPVIDLYQRVVGFSGRFIEDPDPSAAGPEAVAGAGGRHTDSTDSRGERSYVPPKYLNTPETEVFHKGSVLLGLGAARDGIRRSETVVLVEGNFDMLALWESGFRNVVAPMGTALTTQQASILSRLAKTVVLFYDGDNAGRQAGLKAVPLLLQGNVGVKMCDLPDGEDPASYVEKYGKERVRELIEQAPWALERVLDLLSPGANAPVEHRAQALREVSPFISAIPDQIERELYQRRVAELFGVSVRHVLLACRQGRNFQMEGRQGAGGAGGAAVAAPGGAGGGRRGRSGPGVGVIRGGAVADLGERELVKLLFRYPQFSSQVISNDILSVINDRNMAELVRNICMCTGSAGSLNASSLLEKLEGRELKDLAVTLISEAEDMPIDADDAKQWFEDALPKFAQRRFKQDDLLNEALIDAKKRGDAELVNRLLKMRFDNARKCLEEN